MIQLQKNCPLCNFLPGEARLLWSSWLRGLPGEGPGESVSLNFVVNSSLFELRALAISRAIFYYGMEYFWAWSNHFLCSGSAQLLPAQMDVKQKCRCFKFATCSFSVVLFLDVVVVVDVCFVQPATHPSERMGDELIRGTPLWQHYFPVLLVVLKSLFDFSFWLNFLPPSIRSAQIVQFPPVRLQISSCDAISCVSTVNPKSKFVLLLILSSAAKIKNTFNFSITSFRNLTQKKNSFCVDFVAVLRSQNYHFRFLFVYNRGHGNPTHQSRTQFECKCPNNRAFSLSLSRWLQERAYLQPQKYAKTN